MFCKNLRDACSVLEIFIVKILAMRAILKFRFFLKRGRKLQRNKKSKSRFLDWYALQTKKVQVTIGCSTIVGVLLLCGMCSVVGNAISAGSTSSNSKQIALTTPTNTIDIVTTLPTTTPKPTNTPTPIPTRKPTPRPTEKPTQQPVHTGVNGNPWGYDFVQGNLIYDPASDFCAYFSCIKSFWQSTNGYVVECGDGEYSHSGGVRGACSRNGGEYRILYSH